MHTLSQLKFTVTLSGDKLIHIYQITLGCYQYSSVTIMPVLSEQFIVDVLVHYFCVKNVWVEPSFRHEDNVWVIRVKYLPKALLFGHNSLCINNNY